MQKALFFLLITISSFAQQDNSTHSIRSELMLGKSIPSYEFLTDKMPQFVLGLSYTHKNNDQSVEWQSILNYPTTGVGLYYTNYGTSIKGQSISLIPFLEFYPCKNHKWSTKLGIGITYFDTKYHIINNPLNQAVSSDYTWAVQGFIYYDIQLKKHNLRLGLGVFHHSNGHTKLPNEGLNSALLSVSHQFNLPSKKLKNNTKSFDKNSINKFGDYFYNFRVGNGIQAFLTEDSKLKSVYSASATAGIFYKNIVKLSFGVNYRFYQHYYDFIIENNTNPYIKKPKWGSSNIYLSVGTEVLLGYVGIDWEGGLNLHKPFYKTHYDLQKSQNETKYKLKNLFLGRLGLKLYAINTKKKPTTNFFIAAHINSNLSQADFSELSIGFTHRIIKKKKLPFRAY